MTILQLSVTKLEDDSICFIAIDEEATILGLKEVLQIECQVAVDKFDLVFNNKTLNDAEIVKAVGISNNDLLIMIPRRTRPSSAGSSMPGIPSEVQQLVQRLRSNPQQLDALRRQSPALAQAIDSNDPRQLANLLMQLQQKGIAPQDADLLGANVDPMDPEVQKRIAAAIELENIQSNLETAMEHAPETFARVIMLYVNIKINGVPIKAFVDSGAQSTIMSKNCAERCSIDRLVDKRFQGYAKGVGIQKIIGKVHLCQMEIAGAFLSTSLTVLEDQSMDFLIGLDMLKRHQCCIDLKNNCLTIGTTGAQAPFLSESELPEQAKQEGVMDEASGNDPNNDEIQRALIKSQEEEQDRLRKEAYGGSSPSTSKRKTSSNTSGNTSMVDTPSNAGSSKEPSPFPEDDIAKLTKHNFSRDDAIDALKESSGNSTKALASLFMKAIKKA